MISEKVFDGGLSSYDDDSYEDIIEIKQPSSMQEMASNIPLTAPTTHDMLIYFANRYKESHGFEYVIEWEKEINIFKSFMERYGADAGPMIELLFDKHKGKLDNMVLTATAFTKGSKWIQDKLYIELQQDKIKKENRTSSEGLMDTDEFLKRFTI